MFRTTRIFPPRLGRMLIGGHAVQSLLQLAHHWQFPCHSSWAVVDKPGHSRLDRREDTLFDGFSFGASTVWAPKDLPVRDFESVDIRGPLTTSFRPINRHVQANTGGSTDGKPRDNGDDPNNSEFTSLSLRLTGRPVVSRPATLRASNGAAKYSYDMFVAERRRNPSQCRARHGPHLPGQFCVCSDADGDWKRDERTDSQSDPGVQTAYRAGMRHFAKETHRLGKLVVRQ